jgi:hypothetical protein
LKRRKAEVDEKLLEVAESGTLQIPEDLHEKQFLKCLAQSMKVRLCKL